jgi:hypothetical protein
MSGSYQRTNERVGAARTCQNEDKKIREEKLRKKKGYSHSPKRFTCLPKKTKPGLCCLPSSQLARETDPPDSGEQGYNRGIQPSIRGSELNPHEPLYLPSIFIQNVWWEGSRDHYDVKHET